MTGGTSSPGGRFFLWGAVILFAFLIISPLTAILITGTAHYGNVPNERIFQDIYQKNDLQPPFWPLERNIFEDLSGEQKEVISGYTDENYRNNPGFIGRMNYGACKAIFIDMGDFVHEIVIYNNNTTEYNLEPGLMAEEIKKHPGDDDLTAGYRMYRIYPEFPADYNADTPYIDFTDIWEDSLVSYIGGDLVRVRTEGRFYRNTEGKIAAAFSRTGESDRSGLITSGDETRDSSQISDHSGTVSFNGEYEIFSIPFMAKIYVDSRVSAEPFNDISWFSSENISLFTITGMIGLLVYLWLLLMSGQEVFRHLLKKKEKDDKEKEEEK